MLGRLLLSRIGLVIGGIVLMLAAPARGSFVTSQEVLTAPASEGVGGMMGSEAEDEGDRKVIARVPLVASLLFAGVGSAQGGFGDSLRDGAGGKGGDLAGDWQGSRTAGEQLNSHWICFQESLDIVDAFGARVFRPPEISG